MTGTETLSPDDAGLARAASLLKAGALVAFPTETVYGLGADACNGRAVAAIFSAKDRPRFNPLIVHVPDLETARQIGVFGDCALYLAQAFWPGALTLVVPLGKDSGLSDLVTAGLQSVALRVPELPLARSLLTRTGVPIAAPSANPSGRISPTNAAHVMAGLSGRIGAVIDGGPCGVGLESTIISIGEPPRLLRPGGIPVEAIEACIGRPVLLAEPDTEGVTSPGQLASHYAPEARLRLGADRADPGERLLGFGAIPCDLNLSPTGDLTEAAANLYSHLRALDVQGARIAVASIPETGLGRAINDRLRRAAAPRNQA